MLIVETIGRIRWEHFRQRQIDQGGHLGAEHLAQHGAEGSAGGGDHVRLRARDSAAAEARPLGRGSRSAADGECDEERTGAGPAISLASSRTSDSLRIFGNSALSAASARAAASAANLANLAPSIQGSMPSRVNAERTLSGAPFSSAPTLSTTFYTPSGK